MTPQAQWWSIVHTTFNSQLDAACRCVRPAIQANIYQAGVFPSIRLRGCKQSYKAVLIYKEGPPLPVHWVAVLHTETYRWHTVYIFTLTPKEFNSGGPQNGHKLSHRQSFGFCPRVFVPHLVRRMLLQSCKGTFWDLLQDPWKFPFENHCSIEQRNRSQDWPTRTAPC